MDDTLSWYLVLPWSEKVIISSAETIWLWRIGGKCAIPCLNRVRTFSQDCQVSRRLQARILHIVSLTVFPPPTESPLRVACVHAKSLQLCSTLCDPLDCSPPGSSVHGTLQGRILESILEWVAMPFSRGFSRPKDQTHISCVSCAAGGSSLPSHPQESPLKSGADVINCFISRKQYSAWDIVKWWWWGKVFDSLMKDWLIDRWMDGRSEFFWTKSWISLDFSTSDSPQKGRGDRS